MYVIYLFTVSATQIFVAAEDNVKFEVSTVQPSSDPLSNAQTNQQTQQQPQQQQKPREYIKFKPKNKNNYPQKFSILF